MNKRIIAFISAVAVLFTLFAGISAFAADESAPVIDGAYDEAVTLLSALGVNSLSATDKNVTYNVFLRRTFKHFCHRAVRRLIFPTLREFRSAVRRATQVLHTRTRCAVL
ncbi:MAG: hypothetical protein L6V93_08310 [Clostridiales bacterium]|nr:MAG: hypothetical protein L6V93_08310 [Clostridiales bacterium]